MDSLEQTCGMIRSHLKQLEDQYSIIKSEIVPAIKANRIHSFRADLDSIKNQMDILEIDLCSASEKQKGFFTSQRDDFSKRITELENKLSNINENGLMNVSQVPGKFESVYEIPERQQLVETVDKKLAEADQDLDIIIQDLNKGKNIMLEITEEIVKQQEKLDKITEELKETYSLTKRSKKLLNQIKRQLASDKILWVLIGLIVIAIIVIIALKISGFKGNSASTNIIPNISAVGS